MEMSVAQEIHLNRIKDDTLRLLDAKYRKGAAEHGGNLSDLSPLDLVDAAIDEAIDQLTYLLTLKEKLQCSQPTR